MLSMRNCLDFTLKLSRVKQTRKLSIYARLSQSDAAVENSEHFVRSGTGKDARLSVKLSKNAEEIAQKENFRLKHLPGSFKVRRIELPDRFVNTVEKILSHENLKDITLKSVKLGHYLWMRKLPVEDEEYRAKSNHIEEEVVSEDSVVEPFLSEKQLEGLENSRFQKIRKKLKQLIYHWQPISYDYRTGLEYLVSRTAGEYAAVYKILNEISIRDPKFRPLTLCDFGSGIGSVLWASHVFWGGFLREYLAVDTSRDMNDLSELILRGGSMQNDHWLHGVYFRQFLPASNKIKYDVVVSAYSLLDLSSLQNRIETIDILWKKTNNYLILIERGTNSGFEAIVQARDYILNLNTEGTARSHVFSPCPNDLTCPRFLTDNTPCNFTVRYKPLLPFRKDSTTNEETFSYVVLKKEHRNVNEEGFPRIVRQPLVKGKHVICRLCTQKGNLSEVVLTKAKTQQALYRYARKSQVGDLLPVEEVENLEAYDRKLHGPASDDN